MGDSNDRLDTLFRQYRDACGEPGESPTFMPGLWARIESRQGAAFARVFGHWARLMTIGSAALVLLATALNLSIHPDLRASQSASAMTYADALIADAAVVDVGRQ